MNHPDDASALAQASVQRFRSLSSRIRTELGRVIVGQVPVIDGVLAALFAGGHVLLEGVPGLAKTLLVRTLGDALDLSFSRIQFTPDLMPADIVGTMVLRDREGGGHELVFEEGPIHAHLVLADEINRATPKTQSALLEAMAERTVTVARRTIPLPTPFLVLATQNPIEQEGTYPLPEAQVDRFLVKLLVDYPEEHEYDEILARTTGAEFPRAERVAGAADILELRRIVREVPVPEAVRRYAVRLVRATQPGGGTAPEIVRRAVALGASPRGAQALLLLAKVRALQEGRTYASAADVGWAALPVLRHRVVLSFQGVAERHTQDDLVRAVLDAVPASTAASLPT
jgi:MoxR-like ATPase